MTACPLCLAPDPRHKEHGAGFCAPGAPHTADGLQRRRCRWCRAVFAVPIHGKLGRKSEYCGTEHRRLAKNQMIAESRKRNRQRGSPSPTVDALSDSAFRAAHKATPSILALRAFIGGSVDAIRERARRLGIARPRGRPMTGLAS